MVIFSESTVAVPSLLLHVDENILLRFKSQLSVDLDINPVRFSPGIASQERLTSSYLLFILLVLVWSSSQLGFSWSKRK